MLFVMRKKGLLEVILRAVISLHHRATTKVRVGSKLFKEFLVQVEVHQGSVMLQLLFAITVDLIMKNDE